MTKKFDKLYITLKARLHGLEYYRALLSLETAREIHKGLRKDGITPEFQHQIEIALFLLTLKNVQNLEDVLICALLHDTFEDYPTALTEQWVIDHLGAHILRSLQFLNKNLWANYETYFGNLATDPVASLVKGADRVHNIQSMNRGKFTIEKQKKYADEVMAHFLPMLKKARKRFPMQIDAYYNVENMLKSQHELIMLIVEAKS